MKGKPRTARAPRPAKAGRPPKPMPAPIPDTPENVARAIMKGPPKKGWRYLKQDRNA